MIRVVLDTVMLAALLDSRDKWHEAAVVLRDALKTAHAEVFYLDPVINEVVSVLARRLAEQRRIEQLTGVLDNLEQLAPIDRITWISPHTPLLYPRVLTLVRTHAGELNFHDALIALACEQLGIRYIASFDRDFDRIEWLTRLQQPDDVPLATDE